MTSDFESNLNKIKNAVYGKDMRAAIVNALILAYTGAGDISDLSADFIRAVDNSANEPKETTVQDLLDSFLSLIDKNSESYSVISERIANIVAANNETEGNSELIDLRSSINGTIYPSAGEAVRTEIFKTQPLFTTLYSYFDFNTETNVLTYKINSVNKMVTVFNGKHMSTKYFVPSTTEFDLTDFSGTIMFLIANLSQGTLSLIKQSEYEFNPHDYILLFTYDSVIYPMALNPANLYIDDKSYFDQFSSNVANNLVCFTKNVIVNLASKTITIPANNYAYSSNNGFNNKLNLQRISSEIKIDFEPGSVPISFVVFDISNLTMEFIPYNKFVSEKSKFVLFSVYNNQILPIALNPKNYEYVGNAELEDSSYITINSMIGPMINSSEPFKIVLGGDSITQGVGGTGFDQNGDLILDLGWNTWHRNDNGYCWANLFKTYIESNYNAQVLNNGCSGSGSNIWANNITKLVPADTDLLLLTIGTNDRNGTETITTKDGILNNYYNNLNTIVNYCHSNGINIILCSPIPASAENEEQEGRLINCFDLNGVVQKVAAEHNIEYVNTYNRIFYYVLNNNLNFDDLLVDGLHPNDILYRRMFFEYLDALNLSPSISELD